MKQIIIICALFLVLLLAIVGCLAIFDLMAIDTAVDVGLKFGAVIFLLGICAALIKVLMGSQKES